MFKNHTLNTLRLLQVCAIALFAALPAVGHADSITLTGTIRDFNSWGTTSNGVAGHIDFENPCCGDDKNITQATLGLDGKPILNGSHWSVNSAASFYQWYHDDPTVNMSAAISLTLNQISPTTYQYSSNSFFPIDGQLLNQSACCGHNYGFTTEFHTLFNYQSGNNDTFAFSGDDDVWVFINNQLAIDLGGVHGAEAASVSLNAIANAFGLSDGNNYTLDIFQAERHTSGSNFTMTTSLQLQSVPEPESYALLLAALGILAATRRRRVA
jgi:fibro-slime domain-containing protein